MGALQGAIRAKTGRPLYGRPLRELSAALRGQSDRLEELLRAVAESRAVGPVALAEELRGVLCAEPWRPDPAADRRRALEARIAALSRIDPADYPDRDAEIAILRAELATLVA